MEKIESGLKSKKVVVLGGSSGIGLEVARLASQLGAEVVIASSNAQRVKQAVAEIGGKTTGHAVDLSDEAAIEAFFEATAKQMLVGRIGEPVEIAQTYLYLMQQGFSTGQIVIVDGGTSLV